MPDLSQFGEGAWKFLQDTTLRREWYMTQGGNTLGKYCLDLLNRAPQRPVTVRITAGPPRPLPLPPGASGLPTGLNRGLVSDAVAMLPGMTLATGQGLLQNIVSIFVVLHMTVSV